MSNKKWLFYIIKDNKKYFNEFSIALNVIFLLVLFFEFFLPDNLILKYLQIILWLYFIFEFYIRMKFHKFKKSYIFSFMNILDIVIIFMVFLRFSYFDSTLLHFFTSLKILRSYRVIHELWKVNKFFFYKRELIISVLNLLIFTFFMASLVFTLQSDNPQIVTFLDALYFTITTLTTTWFWDIIVVWTYWKILVVIIMTLWVWLFLKLISVIFRPSKRFYKCKHCWLKMHDRDASHCKHCWHIIYLETAWDQIN